LLFHFALPHIPWYRPACQKQKNIGTFFPYSLLDTFGVLFATSLSRFCGGSQSPMSLQVGTIGLQTWFNMQLVEVSTISTDSRRRMSVDRELFAHVVQQRRHSTTSTSTLTPNAYTPDLALVPKSHTLLSTNITAPIRSAMGYLNGPQNGWPFHRSFRLSIRRASCVTLNRFYVHAVR